MKLQTISLAALVALSSYANAGDTLAEMFSEGKFKGELKSYYFDRDLGTKDGSIINLGVKLDYETASLYGFKVGVGLQTSNSPWVNSEGKNAFKGDMHGEGATLSQAYLSYTKSKTSIKAGRQYVKMPLIKGSGSRLIVQSFEGITAVSKDIANTTLYGGYIEKFQNRVDGSGDIAEFNKLSGDYAYALGIKNKSIAGTTITAAYGELESSHSMYYLEAKYKGKSDSLSYNIAGQYSATDYESNAKTDANYYGLKLGLGINGLNTYIAYTEVQDGTAQFAVAGHGQKPTIFTSAVQDAGQYAESEQYAIDVNYNFKEINTKIGARYVNVDYATNASADWKILYGSYKFKGALKGLSTNVVYEDKDDDSNSAKDKQELWIKLSYKF